MSAEIEQIGDQVPRREAVLAFIIETITRYGTAPTFDEIGRHIGVSKTRAGELIKQLIDRGLIERTPGAQRSFRVVDTETSRNLVLEALKRLGWTVDVGELQGRMPSRVPPRVPALTMLPPFEHLPDEDLAGADVLIAALDRAA